MMVPQTELFDYSNVSSLKLFAETHPQVMEQRVNLMDWDFEFDTSQKHLSIKERILAFIERHTGARLFEFKNYR